MAERIWITRPEADSIAFAAELEHDGVPSLIAPLTRIVAMPFSPPASTPSAVLLTSRHAAHALAALPEAWRDLPVYCVGSATAQAAMHAGATQVIAGEANVLALLPRIANNMASGTTLLYLAGEEVKTDVSVLLGTQGIHATTCTVYSATAEASLPLYAADAITAGDVCGVALFSPRSAALAAAMLDAAGLAAAARTMHAYCLSLDVAAAAGQYHWASLQACNVPTRHAMRDLIVSHREKTL